MIKIGGSILTHKHTAEARLKIFELEAWKEPLLSLQRQGWRILLGHGAGSYGHPPTKKLFRYQEEGRSADTREEAKKVRLAMKTLHKELKELLSGLPVKSVIPHQTSSLSKDVAQAWKERKIPLIHGDLFWDEEEKEYWVRSTEELFCEIAQEEKVCITKICLLLSDVPGVLKNPDVMDQGHHSIISRDTHHLLRLTPSQDTTGGMKSKVHWAYTLAKKGVETRILGLSDGPEVFWKLLEGESIKHGTLVKTEGALSS